MNSGWTISEVSPLQAHDAIAEPRLAKEEKTRQRIKAGELGLDLYGLRDVLEQRGVEWKD